LLLIKDFVIINQDNEKLTWRFKAEITSACSFTAFHQLQCVVKLMQYTKAQIMNSVAQLQLCNMTTWSIHE